METAPIVWNDTVYVTSSHDNVYALDAKTGAQIWMFVYQARGFGIEANRGVGLLNGRLYLGTLDGHLIALDATTGNVLWNVVGVHDTRNSYYTMAPLPFRNVVLIGVSNGDWGGIGYVTAFDAATGKRAWEWQTVPGPGTPGHETWSGDSWKTGGGAVWAGLTLDPDTATLYIDTGNPDPDLVGTKRLGANLYTDSMVALDISTNRPRLKWYRQLIPHDTHDWDAGMAPVLFTARVNGAPRSVAATADKGGNFWLLDAVTGAVLERSVVSTQTQPTEDPDVEGNVACPGTNGGVQYNGGAYLPELNAFYVPSIDQCAVFTSDEGSKYVPGQIYLAGGVTVVGGSTGWMNAIDMGTGRMLWRRKLPLPALGGALALSGGIVFSGQLDGTFQAYDANNGNVLWMGQTGSPIKAPPSAYVVDGKPYVVVASGQPGKNFTFPGEPLTNAGSLISAFTLP
jgi:alcohol dehydrogenase (cytochrome c)